MTKFVFTERRVVSAHDFYLPADGAQARGARVRDARGRGSGAAVLRRGTKSKLHLIITE